MGISLVSAPVIGFDLVRHPRGSAVADTLLWAMNLQPKDLVLFGMVCAGADRAVRTRARALVDLARSDFGASGAAGASGSVGAAGPSGSVGTAGPSGRSGAPLDAGGTLTAMVDSLRRSLIIDLDDLDRLVGQDVLLWALEPGDETIVPADLEATLRCVCDALAADWVEGLPGPIRAELREPFDRARALIGERQPDVGPCAELIDSVLARLRSLDPDARQRLRMVNSLLGPGGNTWAEAVHEASWAALTTGRIRAAASAQLLAAIAFGDGGLDAADGAEGLWNLISGHLQACAVFDVLPESTGSALARGWRAALEPR